MATGTVLERPRIGIPPLRDVPVVPALVGVALSSAYLLLTNPGRDAAVAIPALWVLVFLSTEDLRRRIIPNRIVVPAWVLALVLNTWLHPGRAADWIGWSFGSAFLFLACALATRGGLGMGDVKLVGFLGAVLGSQVVPALVIGTSLGAVAAIAILCREGAAARKRAIAYGPFIAAGGIVTLLL